MFKKLLVLTAAAGIAAGALSTVPAFAAKGGGKGGSGGTTSSSGCSSTASLADLINSSSCWVTQDNTGSYYKTPMSGAPYDGYTFTLSPDPGVTPVRAGEPISIRLFDATGKENPLNWTASITCFQDMQTATPRTVTSVGASFSPMFSSSAAVMIDRRTFQVGHESVYINGVTGWTAGPARCELVGLANVPVGTSWQSVFFGKMAFTINESVYDLKVSGGTFSTGASVSLIDRATGLALSALPKPMYLDYSCIAANGASVAVKNIPMTGPVMQIANGGGTWTSGAASCKIQVKATTNTEPHLALRFYTVAA